VTLRSLQFKSFHLSTKSGPNGPGNALWASPYDLISLPQELREAIYIVGGEKLKEKMITFMSGLLDQKWSNYLWHFLGIPKDGNQGNIRILSGFPDKELKTRVIAIGDYYSQSALIPLHK